MKVIINVPDTTKAVSITTISHSNEFTLQPTMELSTNIYTIEELEEGELTND